MIRKYSVVHLLLKYSYFTIAFMILALCGSVRGQSLNVDSLKNKLANYTISDTVRVNLLNDLFDEIYDAESALAKQLVDESEAISDSLNFKKGKAKVFYMRGHLAKKEGKNEVALSYYRKSLTVYEELEQSQGISYCLNAIGIIYYNQGEYSKSLEYYRKSLKIDRELNDLIGVSACLLNIGNIQADQGEYNKAILTYLEAKDIIKKLDDPVRLARIDSNIGSIYGELGNFPEALEYFYKALVTLESAGINEKLPSLFSNIGFIHKVNGRLDEALVYYQKGLDISRKLDDNRAISIFLQNIGSIYFHQDSLKKALFYFKESVIINEEIHNQVGLATSISHIASIEMKQGNYDTAIANFNHAIMINQKTGYKIGLMKPQLGIAQAYFNQKKYNKALESAQRSYQLAVELKLLTGQSTASGLLSEIYEALNQYKNALEYHQKYKSLSDSVLNKENIQKLTRLESEYKFQKALSSAKERETKLSGRIKTADQNLEIAQNQNLLAIIIILILIILLVIGFFLKRIDRIKSVNHGILIEQKLLRSQMTPHFIFNSLSVLQGMILNKELKKAILYLSKFSRLLRITLENSRDKIVVLDHEINALENYLIMQNLGSEIPYQYKITVDEHINKMQTMVPPMMIQPFVENAVEHAFEESNRDRKIFIGVQFQTKKIVCTIKDNGVGIDSKPSNKINSKKSLSTTITEERLQLLSKEFKINSNVIICDRKQFNEKGTEVILTIPHISKTI